MPPAVAEPRLPLWPAAAAAAAAGAAASSLPLSPVWRVAEASLEAGEGGRALGALLAADAAFGCAAFAFLRLAEAYGRQRHPRGGVKPYKGEWVGGWELGWAGFCGAKRGGVVAPAP